MVAFLSLILLLIAVAFFTLLERKVLSFIILRVGPNKPSFIGIFTPFADALKLLTKPFLRPALASSFLIRSACFVLFLVPCILWLFVPLASTYCSWSLVALAILIWISLSVYGLLAAGWGSNSSYSSLAGTRCLAQCISYEVCLTLVFLSISQVCSLLFFTSLAIPLVFQWTHLIFLLFLIALAETNRSPFDFAEGESELVSGYNVEFSGSGFVVIFLSEYLSILFLCSLVSAISLSSSYLINSFGSLTIAFFFIWVRGTLPRYRYDSLIYLCWKSLLPISLSSFLLLLLL